MLEGDEKEVLKVIDKINGDKRHRGIIKLTEGFRSVRHFPEWTIGFRELNSADVKSVAGYSEFLNTAQTT